MKKLGLIFFMFHKYSAAAASAINRNERNASALRVIFCRQLHCQSAIPEISPNLLSLKNLRQYLVEQQKSEKDHQ
jgi:hypothetical protein